MWKDRQFLKRNQGGYEKEMRWDWSGTKTENRRLKHIQDLLHVKEKLKRKKASEQRGAEKGNGTGIFGGLNMQVVNPPKNLEGKKSEGQNGTLGFLDAHDQGLPDFAGSEVHYGEALRRGV